MTVGSAISIVGKYIKGGNEWIKNISTTLQKESFGCFQVANGKIFITAKCIDNYLWIEMFFNNCSFKRVPFALLLNRRIEVLQKMGRKNLKSGGYLYTPTDLKMINFRMFKG